MILPNKLMAYSYDKEKLGKTITLQRSNIRHIMFQTLNTITELQVAN